MPFILKDEQLKYLSLLSKLSPEDVVELCKVSFDYMINGENIERNNELATKYKTDTNTFVCIMEALISTLIDAAKFNVNQEEIMNLQQETKLSIEVLEILGQFINSKRRFVESTIKTANLRSYRIVHLEWRLETRIASRCLLKQNTILVTMKLYLHTEPKNENRDLLYYQENNIIHPDERRNRKDIIVQTDICSLLHMIQTLEDALMESKTRRIRNLVDGLK